MYTLYGTERSGSAAIEMALIQCGAEYRLVKASSWEEDANRNALRQLNPLMQIPTLVLPDGSVLTESAAIMIFLGLEYRDSGILSTVPSIRAQQMRGLIYIGTNCYASVGIIDYPERWLLSGTEEQYNQLVEGATRRLHQQWDAFSDIFQATPAWFPQAPGGLEMLACVVTRWGKTRDHLRTSRAAFTASLSETERHPCVSQVIRNHWPTSGLHQI